MTLIDLFLSIPFALKIAVGIPLFVWAVEVFVMPFKRNKDSIMIKEQNELLRRLLVSIEQSNKEQVDNARILSLLLGYLSKDNKSEEK